MSQVPSPITGYAFTPEDGRKGAAIANAVIAQRAAQRAQTIAIADRIVQGIEEGDIGQASLETCARILAKADTVVDSLTVETPLDLQRLAETASTLHKIHRLVTGQSTSNAASIHGDAADLAARRAELLAQLNPLDPANNPPT